MITDKALRWLEKQKAGGHPFYLRVHYTAPHSPWSCENHPSDLYDGDYNDCAFKSIPDNLRPPEWVKYLGRRGKVVFSQSRVEDFLNK